MAELEKQLATAAPAEPEEAKGAGHSAILISRERYMPNEGVIIDEAL